ncbi:MAG: ATP-binding protein [Gemmatimonadota bacterium]
MQTRAAPLTVAVASGKGGTGKTTVATSLAMVAAGTGRPVCFFDADVEAPNGHLFLEPEIAREGPVRLLVPEVDADRCNGCGRCAELCQYGAIIAVGRRAIVLADLCHGCGGCALVCPERAIRDRPRPIGTVVEGRADTLAFVSGRLDIGQALAPPVIRAARRRLPRNTTVIVDAPPGTSCPAVHAVRGADVVVLVTEPTPFGLHDLELAVDMVRLLEIPIGVVVNRADGDSADVERYCRDQALPVLASLPEDRRVAEACARARLTVEALPEYGPAYLELWQRIEELAA